MSKVDKAITVSNISKSYKISHQLERNAHPTLRDDLVHYARKPLEWIGAAGGKSKEEFWALKDIGFEVNQGDVVGIMGPNGSGKSTLFKILSRITQPTTGQVAINGKTASLLEVGTGFHHELTGRENVYFNGAVLGMSKKDIDKNFDDIVAFSEVERFLDTPVKFYSSGMKVRLAFSVAAFLDSEILIIDEVLAVGDVKFKRKSLDRMKELSRDEGRTVLFVSHIVHQIKQVCTRGIILHKGELILDSTLDNTIDKYLEINEAEEDPDGDETARGGQDIAGQDLILDDFKATIKDPKKKGNGPSLEATATISNKTLKNKDHLRMSLIISNGLGSNVAMVNNQISNTDIAFDSKTKSARINVEIKDINLIPDQYFIQIGLRSLTNPDLIYFKKEKAASFNLKPYNYRQMKLKDISSDLPPVLLNQEFKVEYE